MQPRNTPRPPVTVEYECWGRRFTKTFKNAYAARSFYVRKFRQGKNPKVVKGSL